MQRINDPTADQNKFGEGKHGYREENPATNQPATNVRAAPLNALQEEVAGLIEYYGLALNAADNTQLRQAITQAIANQGRPYDLHFIAGWAPDGTGADLAVQVIGRTIMPRDVRISATRGNLTLAPTGTALIVDVEKNGATIFATKPQFEIGATALTPGVIAGGQVDFNTNDVMTIKVYQIGSTIKGQGLTFALVGAAL
ncbi:hypothetical protein [Ferrovibrio sp.]|uniref:hypothetical protein n=1 Tax=Ferrovibrio sp. TaxID=1917215 RepID=UPI0035AEE891